MTPKRTDKDIRITREGDTSWLVELKVPATDETDYNLSKILLLSKAKIAKQHNIPFALLNYQDMQRKIQSEEYALVSFRVVSRRPDQGDIVLRFAKGVADNGVTYDDMLLYIDIFPLKSDGSTTTIADIEAILSKEKVDFSQIDFEMIEKELKKSVSSGLANLDILILEGAYPESARDGEIQFFFELKQSDVDCFISRRKILTDEPICQIIPAKRSRLPGSNVRGKKVYAPEPKDIEIALGEGVSFSRDDKYIIARSDGILKVREEKPKNLLRKARFSFKIEPMVEIDGSEPVNVTTDDHIEIKNGLKAGGSVISRGQVYIEGDVRGNARITTSGDIIIRGDIVDSKVSGKKDIDAMKKVTGTTLMAGGKLMVNGIATNSCLMGDEVFLNIVAGCDVIAGTSVEVDSILKNEEGYIGKIFVGAKNYTGEMIKDNREFINFAESTLDHIGQILGEEAVKSLTPANISRMIMIHLNRIRKEVGVDLSREQTSNIKKIISVVPPMREMMYEKGEAIRQYEQRIKTADKTKCRILVKSFVDSRICVNIEGAEGIIEMSDGAVLLELKGDKLTKKSLKKIRNLNKNKPET